MCVKIVLTGLVMYNQHHTRQVNSFQKVADFEMTQTQALDGKNVENELAMGF